MKNCVLLFSGIFLSILTKYGYGRQLYNLEGIYYNVRIINLTAVDSTGQSYLQDVKWTSREMKQYVSATVINRKTYMMRRVEFHFDRCRDLEFSCEDFQNLNLTRICSYLKMKNQFWSTPLASIRPKSLQKNCPRLDQGIYVMNNASLDINSFIALYKEAPKYYWKVHSYFYNERDELQHQFHMHIYFTPYTKRNNNSASHSL